MKELSIEEKARRYESALEKCRKLYKEAKAKEYTSDIEDYETIFPELRESEDERIRKAISIYLDWLDGRKDCAPKGEYSIRDMIDWLEK